MKVTKGNMKCLDIYKNVKCLFLLKEWLCIIKGYKSEVGAYFPNWEESNP